MSIPRDREKLLNAIIYFCNNTNHCHKLKLMKLLYYLDFWHFKETGKSVTNQIYKAWDLGPVPSKIYYEINPQNNPDDMKDFIFTEEEVTDEIEGKKRLSIKPRKKFNEKIFTKREIEILERVSEIFKEATADQMTDSTHLRNAPWSRTIKEKGKNAEIDYKLSLDNEKNSLTKEIVDDKIQFDKENKELLNCI